MDQYRNNTLHKWRKVSTSKHATRAPRSRWGHASCVIQDQIVFFGGYADSNYMNDLWSFSASTLQWKEIATTGDVPANRSNCTMNYDANTNKIIVFGGGGSSKKRFNTVSVLDWDSKVWTEVHPVELHYPYLIVFGGEGIADLDDLWVFNFNTSKWTEVQIDKNKTKPCARRFHSSVMIGKELFIVAGCYGRYRSLSDVYSLDLTPLIESGDYEALEWKQWRLGGSTVLTRWGHTSSVFEGKIYVFGGRFSNDLNDLLVIDLHSNSIKIVKGSQDAPPARRRHCAGFIGNSLVLFGGFNGEYFNDLHYICLHQQARPTIPKSQIIYKYQSLVKKTEEERRETDFKVTIESGNVYYVNPMLWLPVLGYDSYKIPEILDRLETLNQKDALSLIMYLYTGVGDLENKDLLKEVGLNVENLESLSEGRSYYTSVQSRLKGNNFESRVLSVPGESSGVIKFKSDEWATIMHQHQDSEYYDLLVRSGPETMKVNRTLATKMSPYMLYLLDGEFKDSRSDVLELEVMPERVFKVFLRYFEYDLVLIPENFSQKEWMSLVAAAKYYCLHRLTCICEFQLSLLIMPSNLVEMFHLAAEEELPNLSVCCAEHEIRRIFLAKSYAPSSRTSMLGIYERTPTHEGMTYDFYDKIAPRNQTETRIIGTLSRVYKLNYLDLQQSRLDEPEYTNRQSKTSFESVLDLLEKQNSEVNS